MTHALHYGLGVFEGIRAYKTKDGRLAIFKLDEHIQRFLDSAKIALVSGRTAPLTASRSEVST